MKTKTNLVYLKLFIVFFFSIVFSINLYSQNDYSVFYVYRESNFINSVLCIDKRARLFVDDSKRIELRNGHYDTIRVARGCHEIRIGKQVIFNEKCFNNNTNYYFKIEYNPFSKKSNKFNLIEVSEVSALLELKKIKEGSLKPWDLNEMPMPSLELNGKETLIYNSDCGNVIIKCFKQKIFLSGTRLNINLKFDFFGEGQYEVYPNLFRIETNEDIKVHKIQFYTGPKTNQKVKEVPNSRFIIDKNNLIIVSVNTTIPKIIDKTKTSYIKISPIFLKCNDKKVITDTISISL